MLIEYQLPLTSKRADVVLAGQDRRTGGAAYVVVELKQWSHAELFENDPKMVLVEHMGGGPKLHPSLQAKGYCEYLSGFLSVLKDNQHVVHGVAYLHNAAQADVADLYDLVSDDWTRLFTQTTRGAFIDYLRDRFAPAQVRTPPTGFSPVTSSRPASCSSWPRPRSRTSTSSCSWPNKSLPLSSSCTPLTAPTWATPKPRLS